MEQVAKIKETMVKLEHILGDVGGCIEPSLSKSCAAFTTCIITVGDPIVAAMFESYGVCWANLKGCWVHENSQHFFGLVIFWDHVARQVCCAFVGHLLKLFIMLGLGCTIWGSVETPY